MGPINLIKVGENPNPVRLAFPFTGPFKKSLPYGAFKTGPWVTVTKRA